MPVGVAETFDNFQQEAESQIHSMHHNVGPNNPVRNNGLAEDPMVAFLGFNENSERLNTYLKSLPNGTRCMPQSSRWKNLG